MSMIQEMYTNGNYLRIDQDWGIYSSTWKAKQIMHMLARNRLTPQTICEVGCGAGEILKQLQEQLESKCTFVGYEVSPQAFELCQGRANERLSFKLGDFSQEGEGFFDLLLVIDVLDLVEDYFGFLKAIQSKGQYKIFHVSLNLSVQSALRGKALLRLRQTYGHIHYFNKETLLQMFKEAGYEVLDYCYTNGSIDLPSDEIRRKLMRLPRKIAFALHKDLAVRILGGCKLLVLAK